MSPHHALDLELAMIRDNVQRLTMFAPYMTQEDAAKMCAIADELIKTAVNWSIAA